MAVSRALRRLVWRSDLDLALGMGWHLEGFTFKWEDWEVC